MADHARRREDQQVTPVLLLVASLVVVVTTVGLLALHPIEPVDGWYLLAVPVVLLAALADRRRVPAGYGTSAQVRVSATTALLMVQLMVSPTWVLPVQSFVQFVTSPWRRILVNAALVLTAALSAAATMTVAGGAVVSAGADPGSIAVLAVQALAGGLAWWVTTGVAMVLFLWWIAGVHPRESPVLEPYANRAMLTQITTGIVAGVLVQVSWWLLPLAVLLVWWLHRQLTDQGSAGLAASDPTTSLLRYDVFRSVAYQEQTRARRSGAPLALLILDADRFREVNETVGHVAADGVLRDVARSIAGHVRPADVPARFGGDDFLVLLTDASLPEAQAVAQRLRDAVAERVFEASGLEVRVTLSAGVTGLDPFESLDVALARLDAALYEAKAATD